MPQRLPDIVSALFLVAILAVIGQMALMEKAPEGIGDAPIILQQRETPAATLVGRTRPGLDVPLFGAATSDKPGLALKVVPKTTLDLRLRGIAAAEPASDSWAIIEGPGRKSLAYRVGDRLPGDAELTSIEVERVLLERDGVTEVLYFSEEDAKRFEAEPTRSNAAPSQDVSAIRLGEQSAQQLRAILTQLTVDPSRWSEQVRAIPVIEEGEWRGYRVFPGPQRALFNEAGFRRGDIVTRINGIQLGNSVRADDLVAQLASANRFEVEMIRRDEVKLLDIRL